MSFVITWLTNIILLILLATILELLLPKNALQKYVKMVVGLLLLIVLLQPVFTIFTEDFDRWLYQIAANQSKEENSMEELINLQKREIELGQSAYISKQMADLLLEEVNGHLKTTYGLVVVDLHIEFNEGYQPGSQSSVEDIASIQVQIQPVSESELKEEPEIKEVSIDMVEIDTSLPPIKKEEEDTSDQLLEEVKEDLIKSWEIPEQTLSVVWKGGTSAIEE
ncbi:stage III sporulation protein AF [Alkalihalobacillus pseudalcaliphilus]|uniref:stage III sporulation protein AF n=1 Tax=Alkalihalobacillus pseudalcaliphilus TaxID=79884 RepID=UPI00064DA0F0|nr:stage III sporulation protein AF [Alkalihalobacillus pseudalcaliphilus]KMK76989.1 hypothetical protein AB990_05370 [Alkalihalobacillus pseudalcaliphilus]